MDFQDKFARVFFSLVSVLQVSSSQLRDLLLEGMNVPEPIQTGELNPVSKLRMKPFDDRFYNLSYCATSANCRRGQKILKPERMETGNQKVSKWDGKEEFEKQNRDQLKWQNNPQLISNIANELNNINNQLKRLQMMSKIIQNLKAEITQMKKSMSFDSSDKSYDKTNSDDEIENKIKITDKNTAKQVNNKPYNNQYLIGNIYIINRLLKKKNSTDIEILKELTDHKIEELLEKAVNNLTEGEFPPVTQSPHLEYKIDLVKQLQKNFSRMFNHQNVTLKHVEQMSKIVDFVERYHGIVGDLHVVDRSKSGLKKNLGHTMDKTVDERRGEEGRKPGCLRSSKIPEKGLK